MALTDASVGRWRRRNPRRAWRGLAIEECHIAESIGVAHGTVYGCFRSKQELFFSLLEGPIADLNREAAVMLAAVQDVCGLTKTLVDLSGHFLIEHKRLLDVGFTTLPQLPEEMQRWLWAQRHEAQEVVVSAMRRVLGGRSGVSADVAAFAVDGAVQAVLLGRFFAGCSSGIEPGVRERSQDALHSIKEELKRLLVPGLT